MRQALHRLRVELRRRRHKPSSREQLHRYWSNPPDPGNRPIDYLQTEFGQERSEYVVDILRRHVETPGAILELGCNVGRNLHYLHQAGWTQQTAIEVNANALQELRTAFPHVAADATLLQGTLEDRLPTLADDAFDVVFSVAVLEHVHYDSDWILEHVVRISRGFVLSIENEEDISSRTFPRNYREVFESLGATQVAEKSPVPGLPQGFVSRLFTVPR